MKTDWRALLWLILILLAIFAAGWIARGFVKPHIGQGSETVRDSVVVHDTLTIKGDTVIVYKQAKPKPAIDTAAHDSSSVKPPPDSEVCYASEKDTLGAYFRMSICSRFLPSVKPYDLSSTILYKPKNDSIKIINRTDSLYIDKTTPILANWKFYLGLLLALAAGYEAHRL